MSVQFRGHCQVCGREHAVTRGRIAKHGYTLEFGCYSGKCPGSNRAPIEHQTALATATSEQSRDHAATIVAYAARLESGEETPVTVPAGGLEQLVYSLRIAAQGEHAYAQHLEACVTTYSGAALREVERR